MIENESQRTRMLVIDVPDEFTAEAAGQLLNEACDKGYYVVAIHSKECSVGLGGVRAFFNLRKGAIGEGKNDGAIGDGQNEAARTIIAAHPDKSIREIVLLLSDAGIKRGKTWVCETRMALKRGPKLAAVI